ncbi:MAG: hypothetical protein RLO17_13775 [Cyclobacteriaceae bacterium]
MAEELENIFLSASIPMAERDPKYIESADVIAIRDAVTALVEVVIPKFRLIWGGHPSITPLVYQVVLKKEQEGERLIQRHVKLYQSRFFERFFPPDNNQFENVTLIESTGERESSLLEMRTRMFHHGRYKAGIFIGGMEGVEDEFDLFREYHPEARLIPVASSGAAAEMIYRKVEFNDHRLLDDYSYFSLFKDYLLDQ